MWFTVAGDLGCIQLKQPADQRIYDYVLCGLLNWTVKVAQYALNLHDAA